VIVAATALAALTNFERAGHTLTYFGGLPEEEAAELLNRTPKPSVKPHLRQGFRRLNSGKDHWADSRDCLPVRPCYAADTRTEETRAEEGKPGTLYQEGARADPRDAVRTRLVPLAPSEGPLAPTEEGVLL
jgi:hypothetical protein